MGRILRIIFISFLTTGIVSGYFNTLLLKIAFWQVKGLINFSLIDFIKDISSVKKSDPYGAIKAQVRNSSSLCSQEKIFRENRKLVLHSSIENITGSTLSKEHIPTIGLCFSGGGYRAMIGTLAILSAAQQGGLLDSITYISALSGSTWALSTWLGHDLALDDLILLTKSQISGSLAQGIDRRLLVENSIWKLFYGQKLSLVGIWGSLIANVLFSDFERNYIGVMPKRIMRGKMPKLSQFGAKTDSGAYPLPLFTAVSISQGYEWLEFSPYEVGLLKQKRYIPSWSFGRRFFQGVSTDFPPEHGIDYLMGIWGSAFTASLGEILGHCLERKFVEEIAGVENLNPLCQLDCVSAKLKSEFLKLRLSPAKVKSLISDDVNAFHTLVDAGVDFNLPLPPLLKKERELDLIIICDFSSNADTADELTSARRYALKNGLKFPDIPSNFVNNGIVTVLEDKDPTVPIVVYMPLIKNETYSPSYDPKDLMKRGGYCSTFNLQYSPQQFDELFRFVVHNFKESKEKLKEVIKEVIVKKELASRNNFA